MVVVLLDIALYLLVVDPDGIAKNKTKFNVNLYYQVLLSKIIPVGVVDQARESLKVVLQPSIVMVGVDGQFQDIYLKPVERV